MSFGDVAGAGDPPSPATASRSSRTWPRRSPRTPTPCARWPSVGAIFLPGGRPPTVGERFVQRRPGRDDPAHGRRGARRRRAIGAGRARGRARGVLRGRHRRRHRRAPARAGRAARPRRPGGVPLALRAAGAHPLARLRGADLRPVVPGTGAGAGAADARARRPRSPRPPRRRPRPPGLRGAQGGVRRPRVPLRRPGDRRRRPRRAAVRRARPRPPGRHRQRRAEPAMPPPLGRPFDPAPAAAGHRGDAAARGRWTRRTSASSTAGGNAFSAMPSDGAFCSPAVPGPRHRAVRRAADQSRPTRATRRGSPRASARA